jgi:hypothetical protein
MRRTVENFNVPYDELTEEQREQLSNIYQDNGLLTGLNRHPLEGVTLADHVAAAEAAEKFTDSKSNGGNKTMTHPTNNAVHLFRRVWPGAAVNRNVHKGDSEMMSEIVDKELEKSHEEYSWRQLGPAQREVLLEPHLLAKSKECGRKDGQTLAAWLAVTGLNKRQLTEWRIDKLVAFAAQTAANDLEQGIKEPKSQFTF